MYTTSRTFPIKEKYIPGLYLSYILYTLQLGIIFQAGFSINLETTFNLGLELQLRSITFSFYFGRNVM